MTTLNEKKMRKTFEGVVTVYRVGISETLQAEFEDAEGNTFHWFEAPKCFVKLTYGPGAGNRFACQFTAGLNGSNPRKVVFLNWIAK